MHQITAYGESGPALFEQAIIQSPGFFPMVSNQQQEQIFNNYLSLLDVGSIEEARLLSFSELQKASVQQVEASPYGLYTFGPAIDGDFVPALPGELLLHGQFAENVTVMVGHNENEVSHDFAVISITTSVLNTNQGLLFTSPFIQNNSGFTDQVLQLAPSVAAYPETLDYITNTMYPPKFDGSQAQRYTSQVARAAAQISEMVFSCNTFYLNKAYNNDTYSYYFTVPPAIHGADVPYTYYNGPNSQVVDSQAALTLQKIITNFVEKGGPNGDGVPRFPTYGDNATVLELNVTTSTREDPVANYRCDWWQKVLYA